MAEGRRRYLCLSRAFLFAVADCSEDFCEFFFCQMIQLFEWIVWWSLKKGVEVRDHIQALLLIHEALRSAVKAVDHVEVLHAAFREVARTRTHAGFFWNYHWITNHWNYHWISVVCATCGRRFCNM